MKKILTLIIVVLAIFLIYLGFKDKKIYYLSIGDGLAEGINPYGSKDYGFADYVKDYLNEAEKLEKYVYLTNQNKRATDIIQEINSNVEIDVEGKKKTFQNALIKADIVTLSVGMNDLFANLQINNDFNTSDLQEKMEQITDDLDQLFKLLREYCKEQIIYIGLYNRADYDLDGFMKYANDRIKQIADEYGIEYISIYEEFSKDEYFPNDTNYPNKEGYKVISDKIISKIGKS